MKIPKITIVGMALSCFLLPITIGCFTHALVQSTPLSESNRVVLTDTVMAIGQPDEASMKRIGNPDALVFLGQRNSYYLTEGGTAFVNIARLLDGNLIGIDNKSPSMYSKEQKIWGSLRLTYTSKTFENSSKDLTNLNSLGFTKNINNPLVYEKVIQVKGIICPKIEVPKEKIESFKIYRPISFIAPPKSMLPPLIERIVLFPVALAADVATAPVLVLIVFAAIKDGAH